MTELTISELQKIGTQFYQEGKISKAIDVFKKVLEIDPNNTDSAICLSVLYNDIGKYDDAKKIYQIANHSLQNKKNGIDLNLDIKFALKHIEIGDLYFKYHRYEEALEEYSKAALLDTTLLDVRTKLAKVYVKKGFTTRAIQELQQLCKDNPQYISARIQLGLIYFSQGNVIDAQLEFEKAKEIDPLHPEVLEYLEAIANTKETSL